MEVIKSSNFDKFKLKPMVLALGSFDGLHLGHQAIINKAIRQSKKKNLLSAVYTFYPHPQRVLNPQSAPKSLLSNEQKIKILKDMGIDYFLQQIFSLDFSQIDFKYFIKEILLDSLQIKELIIGEDFRFGHQGKGNVSIIRQLAEKLNFAVTVIKTVKINSQRISSTKIREEIMQGNIDKISAYLGRNYSIEGKVVPGEGRGNKMGFPTANLKLVTDYALPPVGVYVVNVNYQGQKFKGIANLGFKPTFPGNDYTIEVHIFGLKQDIYGQIISLEIVEFLRPEITFSSSSTLITQIEKDIKRAQDFFNKKINKNKK